MFQEIQRIASIVSINLFRITREDTMVGGHLVAGGTPLTAEVSVLMYEDEHFDHPEKVFGISRRTQELFLVRSISLLQEQQSRTACSPIRNGKKSLPR